MVPAAALDELVEKVRALDMDEVRKGIDQQRQEMPETASAGGR
jgi:hypothetical protein